MTDLSIEWWAILKEHFCQKLSFQQLSGLASMIKNIITTRWTILHSFEALISIKSTKKRGLSWKISPKQKIFTRTIPKDGKSRSHSRSTKLAHYFNKQCARSIFVTWLIKWIYNNNCYLLCYLCFIQFLRYNVRVNTGLENWLFAFMV